MSGVPYGQYSARFLPFAIVPIVYAYYALYYRPSRVRHDAELAREFCPDFVTEFLRCQEHDGLHKCSKEMIGLHNCLYRLKGFNKEDKDLL